MDAQIPRAPSDESSLEPSNESSWQADHLALGFGVQLGRLLLLVLGLSPVSSCLQSRALRSRAARFGGGGG